MNTKLTIGIIAIAALMLALSSVVTNQASAAIHDKNTGCTNNGGQSVDGKTTCPSNPSSNSKQKQETCKANSGANEKCVPGLNK
jgi:hypothetical protein